jgi:hypothetical protein
MKKIFSYPIILLIISCQQNLHGSLKPTYNKGGYTLSINKRNGLSTISVSGEFRDVESNTLIKQGWVTSACTKSLINSLGSYKFKIDKFDGNIFLTSTSIGYRPIETERFKIEKGDSIIVNFFLAQDDRPLYNCEGQANKE